MMVPFSKILALPFYPLGLALILCAAGVTLLYLRKLKLGRTLVLCGGIELFLFSSDPLSHLLVRSLERSYDPASSFPPVSAVVLLSGGETPKLPPRLFDEVNDAGDRIIQAARLVKQGAAPYLIIAGGKVPFTPSAAGSVAAANRRLLTEALSVDPSVIVLEERSRNTHENCLFTKKLCDSLKLPPTVILVTSAMHMLRSAALFKKAGFTVYPAPTDYRADVPYHWTLLSIFPNAAALYNSSCAFHEIYGIIAYKLLGRL